MEIPTTSTTRARRAIILAGGAMHAAPSADPNGAIVIAADSGYDHARAMGLTVDVLVGDMDSISAPGLEHAAAHDVAIERHDSSKDETDLELALAVARRLGATTVAIHGGEDGRIAHLLGIALGLTHARIDDLDVAWHTRTGVIRVATPSRTVRVEGTVGDIVSLIPSGNVAGVTTEGLRWHLADDALEAGSTRGLSNEMTTRSASVSVRSGRLLVIAEREER
ncbi:MAG: thiamine diphosphokinase [Acidimicrobiia bacterium]